MKQVLDKSQIAVRKCKTDGARLNAGICKDPDKLKHMIFKDIAYRFLNSVRGSPPYFQSLTKDIFSMCRQLGPATLFVTFSAAEKVASSAENTGSSC